ncbi:hypothetical protein HK100_004691, partial [Physocladia obscura]
MHDQVIFNSLGISRVQNFFNNGRHNVRVPEGSNQDIPIGPGGIDLFGGTINNSMGTCIGGLQPRSSGQNNSTGMCASGPQSNAQCSGPGPNAQSASQFLQISSQNMQLTSSSSTNSQNNNNSNTQDMQNNGSPNGTADISRQALKGTY